LIARCSRWRFTQGLQEADADWMSVELLVDLRSVGADGSNRLEIQHSGYFYELLVACAEQGWPADCPPVRLSWPDPLGLHGEAVAEADQSRPS